MIIGSTCIKHWFPDFPREPKDIDYITSQQFPVEESSYFTRDTNLKIEILDNPVLQSYVLNEHGHIPKYCPKDALYTLKLSHSFWSLDNGSWEKHMWDIQWLKDKGCVLIEPLFYELYLHWCTFHGSNKRSNLEMNSEQFFDNAVNFPVSHDTLHEMLIQHEYFNNQQAPTYTLILKDNCEVDVDEKKYNQLTELQKYNLVFEEVAVMAHERYNKVLYKKAYNIMLKKFIISHAPLWEAMWIIQNHKLLLTTIPFNFIKHLDNEIRTNIRPIHD